MKQLAISRKKPNNIRCVTVAFQCVRGRESLQSDENDVTVDVERSSNRCTYFSNMDNVCVAVTVNQS